MKTLTSPITSSVSIWVSLYNLFSILTFLLHSFILPNHLQSYKLLKCYANKCWTYSRHPFFVPLHCPPILLARRTPTHPSKMLNFTSTMKPFHTSPKRVKYFLCGAKALHKLITLSRVFCLYPSLSVDYEFKDLLGPWFLLVCALHVSQRLAWCSINVRRT